MELNERGGVIREDCDPGCGGPLPGLSARDALHPAKQELVFLDKDSTEAEILAAGADAEVLFVDAITVVSAALMEHMPCLRLIHSEGVAFDRIDLSAARERGIYVCNNKGCNAGAVAEQTVLLILMLLRHALEGTRPSGRDGRWR